MGQGPIHFVMYDWKKKYEDAIIGIKAVYETADAATRSALETKFPELTESKDERIRKAIITLVRSVNNDLVIGVEKRLCLAWLERQKDSLHEQETCKENQVSFTDTDGGVVGRRGRLGGVPQKIRADAEKYRDKIEPPYDADDICSAYETGAMEYFISPSSAQLEALDLAIRSGYRESDLLPLYEQLKKLKIK